MVKPAARWFVIYTDILFGCMVAILALGSLMAILMSAKEILNAVSQGNYRDAVAAGVFALAFMGVGVCILLFTKRLIRVMRADTSCKDPKELMRRMFI